ncbi:hypothetical protein Tco_0394088 [Tanacetum coccineum]
MLGPGRYSQWHSRFLRYLDTKSNGEYLRKCIFEGIWTLCQGLQEAKRVKDYALSHRRDWMMCKQADKLSWPRFQEVHLKKSSSTGQTLENRENIDFKTIKESNRNFIDSELKECKTTLDESSWGLVEALLGSQDSSSDCSSGPNSTMSLRSTTTLIDLTSDFKILQT